MEVFHKLQSNPESAQPRFLRPVQNQAPVPHELMSHDLSEYTPSQIAAGERLIFAEE